VIRIFFFKEEEEKEESTLKRVVSILLMWGGSFLAINRQYYTIDISRSIRLTPVRVRHLWFVTERASLIHSSASLISLTLSPSAEPSEGISTWSRLHLQTFKLLLRCEGELRRTTTSRDSVLFY